MIRVIRLLWLCVAAVAMNTPAYAQWEDPQDMSGGVFYGAEVGTCFDGRTMLSLNGITYCGSSTTTDPTAKYINGPDCWGSDVTCTNPGLNICGGLGTHSWSGITAANFGVGDTLTIAIDGTDCVMTNVTDFDCTGTNAQCSLSIKNAVTTKCGAFGVSGQCANATCSTAVVGVQAHRTTNCSITVSRSDATTCTANNGTDGKVKIVGTLLTDPLKNSVSVPAICLDTACAVGIVSTGANIMAFTSGTTNVLQLSTGAATISLPLVSISGAVTLSGTKGQTNTWIRPASQTVTCLGGGSATLVTSGLIPDGAWLIGITTRVTTALTGPTSYSVGDGATAGLYGATLAVAQGTTSTNADATATWANPKIAASEVTITMNGGNCTAGAIAITPNYFTNGAATVN